MTNNNTQIYQDIATRTAGDIYIGVVGPVRAGKSTFIKRFMETQVIPNIDNVYRRERAKDELPQSGSGRMVMTAEPKFVPEEAVDISLGDGAGCSVRLIDCVGYMVPGATGDSDGDAPRMVTTPWSEQEVSMAQAAELGTTRVIREHSTIGVVVTTDGSITDIPREAYIEAEGRVIRELQEIGKPFLVLLNAADPGSERVRAMADDIAKTYGVTCLPVNCLLLDDATVEEVLKAILYEFPVAELDISIPSWVRALSGDHPIKSDCIRPFGRARRICAASDRFPRWWRRWAASRISARRRLLLSSWVPALPPRTCSCLARCSTRPSASNPASRCGTTATC